MITENFLCCMVGFVRLIQVRPDKFWRTRHTTRDSLFIREWQRCVTIWDIVTGIHIRKWYSLVPGTVLDLPKVQGWISNPLWKIAASGGPNMEIRAEHRGFHHEVIKDCKWIGGYLGDCRSVDQECSLFDYLKGLFAWEVSQHLCSRGGFLPWGGYFDFFIPGCSLIFHILQEVPWGLRSPVTL